MPPANGRYTKLQLGSTDLGFVNRPFTACWLPCCSKLICCGILSDSVLLLSACGKMGLLNR